MVSCKLSWELGSIIVKKDSPKIVLSFPLTKTPVIEMYMINRLHSLSYIKESDGRGKNPRALRSETLAVSKVPENQELSLDVTWLSRTTYRATELKMFYTFAQKHQEIHASLAKCFCKYHGIVIKKWLLLGMLFICFALPSCIYKFLKGCALSETIHSLGRDEAAQAMAKNSDLCLHPGTSQMWPE